MSFAVYVLDWAGALMGKGVWVRMHWHEAADAYRAVDDVEGLGPRTVAAHAHLEALMGDGAEGDLDEVICSRMGMDAATWRTIDAAQAAMAASRSRTCDEWDD